MSWNSFRKQHKGSGKSIQELSTMYSHSKNQSSKSRSSKSRSSSGEYVFSKGFGGFTLKQKISKLHDYLLDNAATDEFEYGSFKKNLIHASQTSSASERLMYMLQAMDEILPYGKVEFMLLCSYRKGVRDWNCSEIYDQFRMVAKNLVKNGRRSSSDAIAWLIESAFASTSKNYNTELRRKIAPRFLSILREIDEIHYR